MIWNWFGRERRQRHKLVLMTMKEILYWSISGLVKIWQQLKMSAIPFKKYYQLQARLENYENLVFQRWNCGKFRVKFRFIWYFYQVWEVYCEISHQELKVPNFGKKPSLLSTTFNQFEHSINSLECLWICKKNKRTLNQNAYIWSIFVQFAGKVAHISIHLYLTKLFLILFNDKINFYTLI